VCGRHALYFLQVLSLCNFFYFGCVWWTKLTISFLVHAKHCTTLSYHIGQSFVLNLARRKKSERLYDIQKTRAFMTVISAD